MTSILPIAFLTPFLLAPMLAKLAGFMLRTPGVTWPRSLVFGLFFYLLSVGRTWAYEVGLLTWPPLYLMLAGMAVTVAVASLIFYKRPVTSAVAVPAPAAAGWVGSLCLAGVATLLAFCCTLGMEIALHQFVTLDA